MERGREGMDEEWGVHCTQARLWSTAQGDVERWQEASSSNESSYFA